MIRKIHFFNFFHNGDIFTGKAYVQFIMRSYPGIDYSYSLGTSDAAREIPRFKAAAGTNPRVIADLRCETLTCDVVPPELGWYDRFALVDDRMYVNTWVGAYAQQVFPPGEEHANYPSLRSMWQIVFEELNTRMQLSLEPPSDVWSAVPTTDWTVYDYDSANDFISADRSARRLLFSNGPVNSSQSVWGDSDMRGVIKSLAERRPDWTFVCTRKFDTSMPNIFFTDDIFQQSCDMNEIGYLSTYFDFMWGKVSGPYIYCHVRDNLFNPNKIFFSSSDRPSDSLPYGCDGLQCHYFHSLTGEDITLAEQVEHVVSENVDVTPSGRMIVLD